MGFKLKPWIPLIGIIYASELPSIKFWNIQTILYMLYQIGMEIIFLYISLKHLT